ncbi:MAG: hydrogenase maturation protease [Solirubrobacterales bacterium]
MADKIPVLVLGIGNPLLTDDGVGFHAVNRLSEETMPPGVEVVDGGVHTYDLVDFFCSAETIVVIDALKAGGNPGQLYRAPLEEMGLKSSGGMSVHSMHFIDAMDMVHYVGFYPRVIVYGIEPESLDWGTELSPTVAAKLPRLLERVREEVHKLIQEREGG